MNVGRENAVLHVLVSVHVAHVRHARAVRHGGVRDAVAISERTERIGQDRALCLVLGAGLLGTFGRPALRVGTPERRRTIEKMRKTA